MRLIFSAGDHQAAVQVLFQYRYAAAGKQWWGCVMGPVFLSSGYGYDLFVMKKIGAITGLL
jgi:hypothetical protein